MSTIQEVVDRIERRLAAVGAKPATASKQAGLSVDAIRNLKRAAEGKAPSRGVSSQTLEKLAPVLKTTPGWLMDGTGSEESEERQPGRVPIVGNVSAGSAAYFVPSGDLGETEAPDSSGPATVAVLVRGESMGPLMDGATLFYDDVRRPVTTDLNNKLCVVGLTDGRILVKRLRRSMTNRKKYHLISETEDPITDVEIEWAAKVKLIRPK